MRLFRSLWPTKSQWRSWSLPSKLSAVGAGLGLLGVIISVALYLLSLPTETDPLVREYSARSERIEAVVSAIRRDQVHRPKLYIYHAGTSPDIYNVIRLLEE